MGVGGLGVGVVVGGVEGGGRLAIPNAAVSLLVRFLHQEHSDESRIHFS